MKWITAQLLEELASTAQGPKVLPELVRRLVRASSKQVEDIRFPSGESVFRPGWDGELIALEMPPYVPGGVSVWELSADKDPPAKAWRDFDKRLEPNSPKLISGTPLHEVAYVAVSLRRWIGGKDTNQAEFLEYARGKQVWKEVTVIDADKLEDWIDQNPSVGVWLYQDVLNRAIPDIKSLQSLWAEYSSASHPKMAPGLILCDRAPTVGKLIEAAGSKTATIVQADSSLEAAAFVSAAFLAQDEDHAVRNAVMSKGVVITKKESVEYLRDARNPLCIVAMDQAVESASYLAMQGHEVIVAYGNAQLLRGNLPRLRLERARRHAFAEQLEAMGMTADRAKIASAECNASVTIFRRTTDQYGGVLPNWANHGQLIRLLGPLLAAAWDHTSDADKGILSRLGGVPYNDVEAAVAEFLIADDPPVQRAGDVTALNAPGDILQVSFLSNAISEASLAQFRQCTIEVLGELDPALDLPAKDRGYAGLYGKKRRYSPWLRSGLSEVLRLVAIHGRNLPFPEKSTVEGFVSSIVENIPGLATDYRVLASLDSLLPSLIEATPFPFLKALEDLSSGDGSRLAPIFEGGDDVMFDRTYYLGILRSLELLAWNPPYLIRVTKLLARLAAIDPGGRLSNRPLNSLAEIFLPWQPHTNASQILRHRAIAEILKSSPEIAWKLLALLLPGEMDTSTGTARPEWREFEASEREVPTVGSARADYNEVLRLAIPLAGSDASKWKKLVEAAAQLSLSALQSTLEALVEHEDAISAAGQKAELWDGLREFVAKHRSFSDANWALPVAILDPIDRVLAQFSPESPIARYHHLFDQSLVGHYDSEETFEQRKKRTEDARDVALKQIADAGPDAVIELARMVSAQGLVAASMVRSTSAAFTHDVVLRAFRGDARDVHLASQAAGIGLETYGLDWAKRLYLEALETGPTDKQLAGLLELWPDTNQTFDFVDSAGEEVALHYWQTRDVWIRNESEEVNDRAISEFIRIGRCIELISYIGSRTSKHSSATLLLVLEGALSEAANFPERLRSLHTYWLEKILENLRKRTDVDIETLARLEYSWLPAIFSYTQNQQFALHDYLANSPEFFVQLICDIYREETGELQDLTDSGAESVEGAAIEDVDNGAAALEGEASKARSAHRVLDSWRLLPWKTIDDHIDYDRMLTWVRSVMLLAAEKGRPTSAISEVGKLLAYSPDDTEDLMWPAREVRALIEAISSEELERSIVTELFNKRGPTWRSVDGGGEDERKLANAARETAARLAPAWPRTSEVLRMNARQWDSHAEWEDKRAAEERLRI